MFTTPSLSKEMVLSAIIPVAQVKAGGIDFSVASATLWTEELVVWSVLTFSSLSSSAPQLALQYWHSAVFHS